VEGKGGDGEGKGEGKIREKRRNWGGECCGVQKILRIDPYISSNERTTTDYAYIQVGDGSASKFVGKMQNLRQALQRQLPF